MRGATCLRGFAVILCFFVFLTLASIPASAQYRAFWVDTFNTNLNNHSDVLAVVNNAKASNANALFVQVRRRGDSWYLNSLEALPDGMPIPAGFDPLADIIAEAHSAGIEVHAYVIVGAIYNKHPTITGLPLDPNHIFNQHAWDPVTKQIRTDGENWLTRSLLSSITFNGYRFGSDFWIDPGHPDAEAYTVDVLTHLVRNYDVDGLHLDRIRYPEFTASGQTPSTGTSVGYNPTSVARFQRHYGLPETGLPAQNDPLWSQWRRDQVTNLVRRIYLNAVAVKPQLKVSAATITWGNGPVKEQDWLGAEAYWRVYQDWRAWQEEGIVDMSVPMNYKRDSNASQKAMFDGWTEYMRNHQYDRVIINGLGNYLDAVECTLQQIRRSIAPSPVTGTTLAGTAFYSMATTNAAVTANPCAIPAPQNTPVRPFAEFASALRTGRSVNGVILYENPAANPIPVFASPAEIPLFSWKANPQLGHLMGIINEADGTLVDAGAIQINRVDDGTALLTGRAEVKSATDGGGFYGGVDLAPGLYKVTVAPVGQGTYTMQCTANVVPGQVTSFDFTIDRNSPTTDISADPKSIWPPNNKLVPVTVSGTAKDVGSGIDSITFRVFDEYGFVEPVLAQVDGNGSHEVSWSQTMQLEASRFGDDKDGRTYTIEVTVKDRACNVSTYTEQVVVGHDQRK